jgi:hypothetical protein
MHPNQIGARLQAGDAVCFVFRYGIRYDAALLAGG